MSSEAPKPAPKLLGALLSMLFFTVLCVGVPTLFLSKYLNGAVMTPDTSTPEAAWVPVVNPHETPAGDQVAGVYRATFKDGTTCFAYRGFLVDQFSCVPGGAQ